MNPVKARAITLRSQGLSYSAIEKELGVSKSTLSFWLSSHPWSEDVKDSLRQKAIADATLRLVAVNRVRNIGYQFEYAKAEETAKKEFARLMKASSFAPGVCIYWSLGDKTSGGRIKVSNADSSMLRLFLRFLGEVCEVKKDQIRLTVYSHSDHNGQESQVYWMRELDFQAKNFYKTRVVKRKSTVSKPKFGTCSLELTDTVLKKKLLVWVRLYSEKMSK